jgi:hypothetical protein
LPDHRRTSYPDPDPFVAFAAHLSVHRGGIVIFTNAWNVDGDHLHELRRPNSGQPVIELPRMADYEDPWDKRLLYHDPADDDR